MLYIYKKATEIDTLFFGNFSANQVINFFIHTNILKQPIALTIPASSEIKNRDKHCCTTGGNPPHEELTKYINLCINFISDFECLLDEHGKPVSLTLLDQEPDTQTQR